MHGWAGISPRARSLLAMCCSTEMEPGLSFPWDSPSEPKLIDRATLRGLGNHKNGHELGRRGSPRAHIKPERSYRLQDAI